MTMLHFPQCPFHDQNVNLFIKYTKTHAGLRHLSEKVVLTFLKVVLTF